MIKKIGLIILGLLLIFMFLTFNNTPPKTKGVDAGEQALPTSQPIQTPKPIPLPIHSGRQIKIPILLYHYIADNPDPSDKARDYLSSSPKDFDEQMGYLQKEGYTPITLDTMVAGLYGNTTLPAKPVVITFDDGYQDLYSNAYPILQKYQFKAVAFIPTGLVGTSYYVNWDQLSQMQLSGLLSFQAHSVNHVNLASVSKDRLIYELSESKKILEEKFAIPVNFIAYPYGISDSTVSNTAQKTGYVGALGTWQSNIVSEGVIFNMPRIKIGGQIALPTFASKL